MSRKEIFTQLQRKNVRIDKDTLQEIESQTKLGSLTKRVLARYVTVKRVASQGHKEKLLGLLNSGDVGSIKQALMLNESLGILSDQEIGDLLIPMVMFSNGEYKSGYWKTVDSLGWYLLKALPNHPYWKNLKELNLGGYNLTSLPSEIGNLKNLETLNLGNNNLTSLPSEIGKLKNLTYLNLGNNNLTSLPKEIGNLKNLVELFLKGNGVLDTTLLNGYLSNYILF